MARKLTRLRRVAMRVFADSGHGAEHRRISCGQKVRYPEESAVRAAVRMKEKTGDDFDVYQCQYCNQWHIGHSAKVTVRWEIFGKSTFEGKSYDNVFLAIKAAMRAGKDNGTS